MNKDKNNTVLGRLSRKLTKYWKTSYSSSIVYPDDKNRKNSLIISEIKKIPASKYVFHPIKSFLNKTIDNSLIIKKITFLLEYLLSVSLSCYSVAFASFFAISLLFDVLTNTFTEYGAIFSSVAVLSLIPVFFCKKSLSQMICESGFFSYIFLDLICFERLKKYTKKEPHGNISAWVIVGFITSFFTLIYTRENILIFILLTAITIMFMCRPEASALSIALIIAICPFKITIFLSIVSVFSYVVKAIRGKRSFYFKKYDVPALLIILLICFISSNSNLWLKALPFSSLYFVFSGMLRTKEMLLRCVKNLCASITILASYNIILYFLNNQFNSFSFYLTNGVRINSNFENSESITALYSCAIIFSLSFILFGKEKKGICIFSMAINLISLIFCGVAFALPAVVFSCLFMCFCVYKNKIVVLFVSIAVSGLTLNILNIFKGTYNGFITSIRLFNDYGKYALLGTDYSDMIFNAEGVSNAGNLWMHLSFVGGIVVSFTALFFSLLFIRNCFSKNNSELYIKTNFIRMATCSSILSYVIISFGCYTWDNYKSFCLFWILAGISSNIRRYSLMKSEIQSLSFPDSCYLR